jgi:signal transduction histidine kinase
VLTTKDLVTKEPGTVISLPIEMKSQVTSAIVLASGFAIRAGTLLTLFVLSTWIVCAAPLLIEHFDQEVRDMSPVGEATGWHAYALHGGVTTDFTGTTPGTKFPSLSHHQAGAGDGGVGYLVMGMGGVVSNVLAWMDLSSNLRLQGISAVTFYTKNDAVSSVERVVMQIGGQWYASATTFHDVGANKAWVLNTLTFTTAAASWQVLNTNTLTLGRGLTNALPPGAITAAGIFAEIQPNGGRVRVDEFQVLGPVGIGQPPEDEFQTSSQTCLDPVYLVGDWVWAKQTYNRQTCRFWKLIRIPGQASVTNARLRITADNSYRVFLDGVEFGQGADWRRLTEYDLTLLLTPGVHVLAVQAFNDVGWAGLAAGLVIHLANGRVLAVPSDGSWRIVPDEHKGWMTTKSPGQVWTHVQVLLRFRDLPELPKHLTVQFASALHPGTIRFWQTGWFQLSLLTFSALVMGFCLRLLGQLALQSRAQQVLQRERARMARDIHDDLGAGLTQLVLLGEVAQRECGREPEARARFERVSEAGRRLLRSIDEVVWMLNSRRDSLRDFESYVCRYTKNFVSLGGARCRLEVDAEIPQTAFALEDRRSLFLAIKEALSNAVRHSAATEVRLTLHVENGEVRVSVEDNGKGFEVAGRDLSRTGLSSMMQRMAEVGGECRVISRPDAGCRVELVLPLAKARHRWRIWQRRPSSQQPPNASV